MNLSNTMTVRIVRTCPFGQAGQTVCVTAAVGRMLVLQHIAENSKIVIPDGMAVRITGRNAHGNPGDIKTLSYSVAQSLIARGLAVEVGADPIPVNMPPGPAPHSVKVTAICPTFNRRLYLPTAIGLFLAQTYTNSELLIVDDSGESVAALVPKHPRIRYVRLAPATDKSLLGHDGRMLIGAKRNVCCELAKGEFIVHWDDDDWNDPSRIAHQVSHLERTGKAVLTYHNILYYNDTTDLTCRCFPNAAMRALHGATFCYRKSWWAEHRFNVTGGGEDTAFGTFANSRQQLLVVDAQRYMVVRAHGHDDSLKEARGNTCRTADHMGTYAIPKVNKSEIPQDFFKPLLTPEYVVSLGSIEDAVVGVIKNYDWPAIRPYAVSLSRSGFTGTKLMFVENITPASRAGLLSEGFQLVDFATPPDVRAEENIDYLTFGRHRFKYVIDYLKANPGRFRNIVWCDVRDLIFQTDPSAWLQRGMTAPRQLIAAGEGWLVKNEGYNDRWTRRVSPNDYARLCEEDILCSGSFAGDAETMLGVFEAIYNMTIASRAYRASTLPHTTAVSDNADQGMFNYVSRTTPYREITRVPRMSEGFAATWFPAKSNDLTLIPGYGAPVFNEDDGVIYTPDGKTPFCIVHQYDRDPSWRARIDSKYQSNAHVKHGGKDVVFCEADPTDGVECFQCRGEWHEIENLSFIQSLQLKGEYLDAGAYIGTHSLFFALFCPSDRVHSFEPNTPIYRKLVQNLNANSVAAKCSTYNLALSDQEGYGVSQDMPVVNAHINRAASQLAVRTEPSSVRVVTLDSLNIRPRVIKLDAEGAEYQILRGATETLKTAEHLFIELWDHAGVELRRAEGFLDCEYRYDAVVNLLKLAGFELQPTKLINDIYYFKRERAA